MTTKIPSYATTAEIQAKRTPYDVLTELKAGNERFQQGKPLERNTIALLKYAEEHGQFPSAIVLSCIDSRTAPELVFDQSIGDIFTARVAGNVVDDNILANMEFAVKQMGVKVVVVMGHSDCLALKAAACCTEARGNLRTLLSNIRVLFPEGIEHITEQQCEKTYINQLVKQNVLSTLQQTLYQSVCLEGAVKQQKILLVGAVHWLETGKVEFFDVNAKAI